MNNNDFNQPIWEGLHYEPNPEPYIDIQTFDMGEDEIEFEELVDLILQTQKEMDDGSTQQSPDCIFTHTEPNGQSYLITKNSIHKVFHKKQIIYNLLGKNDNTPIPSDSGQIWFISPTVKE